MGIYVNPTGRSFELAINSEIFVDKSGLIKETNKCINTLQRVYVCKPSKAIRKVNGHGYAFSILWSKD